MFTQTFKKNNITLTVVSSYISAICDTWPNVLFSYCKMRLQPFKSLQRHLRNDNLDIEESKLFKTLSGYHVDPYTLSFKISFSEPEEMLLSPAWWIQLQERAAFRLSLSISAVQDTTVKMNTTQNTRPWKRALSKRGYVEWCNYYGGVMWRWRPSHTNSCKCTKQTVTIIFTICCAQSCTEIIFTGDFHMVRESD